MREREPSCSRGRNPKLRNVSVNPDDSVGERGREQFDGEGEDARSPSLLGDAALYFRKAAVAGRRLLLLTGLPARPRLNIGLVVVCGASAARRPGLAPRPPVAPPKGEAGRRLMLLQKSEYPVECSISAFRSALTSSRFAAASAPTGIWGALDWSRMKSIHSRRCAFPVCDGEVGRSGCWFHAYPLEYAASWSAAP